MKCSFRDLREYLVKDIFIANMNSDLSYISQRLLQEINSSRVQLKQQSQQWIAQRNAYTTEQTSQLHHTEIVMHIEKSKVMITNTIQKTEEGLKVLTVAVQVINVFIISQTSVFIVIKAIKLVLVNYQSNYGQNGSSSDVSCGHCRQHQRFKCNNKNSNIRQLNTLNNSHNEQSENIFYRYNQ